MNDDRANRWTERQERREARWAERLARRDARGRSVARSIKGPVMLITVGVLFALQNFTPYGFEQTWPVLLVVAGLLSLLGRVAAPPPPPVNPAAPPPPYGWPPSPPPPAGDYRSTGYAQSPYSAAAPPQAGQAPEQGTSNPGGAK
ncbi:MAG: DUF5668 domain-containing protein [Bryobacteraceae bacterium]|jgi:hypothetical protein